VINGSNTTTVGMRQDASGKHVPGRHARVQFRVINDGADSARLMVDGVSADGCASRLPRSSTQVDSLRCHHDEKKSVGR
jgi:hypothetical protein